MNQKEIKNLKKQIVDESALNIGYFEGTREAIIQAAPDILEKIMASGTGDYLTTLAKNDDIQFDNVFVSEAVRLMRYSEFKEVAHKFFGYEKGNEEVLAEPITLTRDAFENLKERAKNNFMATPAAFLDEAPTVEVDRINEPIAYNPLTQEIAFLVEDLNVEPYRDENLISDYRSEKRDLILIIDKLEQKLDPLTFDSLVTNTDSGLGDTTSIINEWNKALADKSQEIIKYTACDQVYGDTWDLYYFFDAKSMPGISRENILNYLEHEIGAYYRGDLVELRIFDRDNVETSTYKADRKMFNHNEVDQVKMITGSKDYVDLATGFKLQNLGVKITPEVLNEFLNAEPKDNSLKK
ncbi:LtrM-like protein [Weissella oryzae SG25]|uniref:LtrM-like protein n=1 Tax=Weissella oryzae (strain DSM 25784 / JCM 18191 / LMG 30913 / SG25) TaxID=1329250 RepID=A0A069CVE8_WEIOS|nr:hypothetical protein [Weissella oryzae]GAK31342.1 LtrM-like protein [Weissella oryzae SG25]